MTKTIHKISLLICKGLNNLNPRARYLLCEFVLTVVNKLSKRGAKCQLKGKQLFEGYYDNFTSHSQYCIEGKMYGIVMLIEYGLLIISLL